MHGEAWCQSFVGYCANKAGIPDDVLPNKEASTQDAYRVIIKKGQALSATDARPSDIIYFTNGGAGSIYHVGIVEDVSNGEIHTIEGNTSDMVRRKTYGPSRFGKIMIARPAYPDTSTVTVPSTNSNVTFAQDTGIASYANTRGGNGIKPISRFGQFKDNIYGEGNNIPRKLGRFSGSQKVKLESEEGVATVEYSNMDKAIGKYLSGGYRVPTPTPPKYGKGGNASNDSPSLDNTLIKQIIQILLTVANNTDKLNTIVTILQEKLNINITSKDVANAQTGSSASENLARALMQTNNASSKLNTYADTVGDASINSIIQAMNAIAAE
jgi:cell wall-associated NlpC family hydrolase